MGQTRFYLDSTDPDLLAQSDAGTLTSLLSTLSAADKDMLARTSMLLPGWSVTSDSRTGFPAGTLAPT